MTAFNRIFDQHEPWEVFPSGQAHAELKAICDSEGRAGLRLEYDFKGGGGFVAIRRALPMVLPQAFEIAFAVRGQGPRNDFEFKVVSGPNAWRYRQLSFELASEWAPITITERDLPFAWGPAGGGAPSEVGFVEFVIAAGPGGAGVLELSAPRFEDQTFTTPDATSASSSLPGFSSDGVFNGAGWQAASDDPAPHWETDLGRMVRFGGLIIDWPDEKSRRFEISVSKNGTEWENIFKSDVARGPQSYIPLQRATARYLKVSGSKAIRSLSLKPDAFSSTPNEFLHHVAAEHPRGWFPRYWLREQSYWTPVGSPQGGKRALINEEGLIECDEAGFSLEPFVYSGGQLVSWADVTVELAMAKDGAPLPSVVWRKHAFTLEILPWIEQVNGNQILRVCYRITGALPASLFAVAVRPFQVTPPWQAFRNLGGRSPIERIAWENGRFQVGGKQIVSSVLPIKAGVAGFNEGGVVAFLADGNFPERVHLEDPTGLGSGVMGWPLDGSPFEVTLSYPYSGTLSTSPGQRFDACEEWQRTLAAVEWDVPQCAKPALEALRSAAGHILINRDGPAIQPGPRRYTRSWVRDCVIMGYALCKVGLTDPLRDFLAWYAGFQREDGFIPCVVDRDGVDWLVEHDSHGQFLWGVLQVMRHGGSESFAKSILPHVRRAAEFLIHLRQQHLTPEFQQPEMMAGYGLLPESASHEGYLAHPVHSYWDDFWGIRGLQAAAESAVALGLPEEAKRWKDEAARFQQDVLASVNRVITDRKLSYIPGSVEWADLDPTATANAIGLLDFAGVLPKEPLELMMGAYLQQVDLRKTGKSEASNYSAYEIRIIGALVRMGRRDEANKLLEFFLSDRRPREWNQWPEISWRDPRAPGHLGDLPHTWIAAEYILSLITMVASECEADDSLVLAAGMPWRWIAEGFSVRGLPTRHGLLDFSIAAQGASSISLDIDGSIRLPSGGLFVQPPLPANKRLRIQSRLVEESSARIRIDALPAKLRLELV